MSNGQEYVKDLENSRDMQLKDITDTNHNTKKVLKLLNRSINDLREVGRILRTLPKMISECDKRLVDIDHLLWLEGSNMDEDELQHLIRERYLIGAVRYDSKYLTVKDKHVEELYQLANVIEDKFYNMLVSKTLPDERKYSIRTQYGVDLYNNITKGEETGRFVKLRTEQEISKDIEEMIQVKEPKYKKSSKPSTQELKEKNVGNQSTEYNVKKVPLIDIVDAEEPTPPLPDDVPKYKADGSDYTEETVKQGAFLEERNTPQVAPEPSLSTPELQAYPTATAPKLVSESTLVPPTEEVHVHEPDSRDEVITVEVEQTVLTSERPEKVGIVPELNGIVKKYVDDYVKKEEEPQQYKRTRSQKEADRKRNKRQRKKHEATQNKQRKKELSRQRQQEAYLRELSERKHVQNIVTPQALELLEEIKSARLSNRSNLRNLMVK